MTWGRVPVSGVWPVAKSLDTVGPIAQDVQGLVQGMQMLEPDFELAEPVGLEIGRIGPTRRRTTTPQSTVSLLALNSRLMKSSRPAGMTRDWQIVSSSLPKHGMSTAVSCQSTATASGRMSKSG